MKMTHPILSCAESLIWEKNLLGDDVNRQWEAMTLAGRALGRAILKDYRECQSILKKPHILVLAGKGHNTGDAIIAADEIFRMHPDAKVTLILTSEEASLKPLVKRALGDLKKIMGVQLRLENFETGVDSIAPDLNIRLENLAGKQGFDLCIDGILGMQFHPPIREDVARLLRTVNAFERIGLRAAVDLPSGIGDEVDRSHCFRADFTYATGVAKSPLFFEGNAPVVGRIRYLDIGFFDRESPGAATSILLPSILDKLRQWRPSISDKRSFGHLFVLGGSRAMPGALLMSVKAALKSGVGLVTAFAPESVAAPFAAAAPEAMWVPWPETPSGGLALEGKHLLLERINRANALLMGPGMGLEDETQLLLKEFVGELPLRLVLDADALQPKTIDRVEQRPAEAEPVVITPHWGEFIRLTRWDASVESSTALRDFCKNKNLITVLKGRITRIGKDDGVSPLMHSIFGGPVLARGGSGDLLCGLIAGLLSQPHGDVFEAACRGVTWHGMAADALARERGSVSITITEFLDFLPKVLRQS